jgi:pimeloyl-ACP methyl ester carboxylesterase
MPRAHVKGEYIDYNDAGSGEPLFLVQGLTGGRNDWFFQMRSLAKRYRVVTFDNRGARGTARSGESYDIRIMADDTIGLMDYLNIDRAHILGMSLGSLVAQEIAISYPDRVRKLILVAAFAPGDEAREMSEGMRAALGLPDGYTGEQADVMDNRDAMSFFTEVTALSFNNRLLRAILVPLAKRYARKVGCEGLIGQLRATAGCQTLDRLHNIKAPTLVLVGTGDRVVPPESSDMIASRIPNATLVKVEGGSHAFYMEKARRFNREVLDFLGKD